MVKHAKVPQKYVGRTYDANKPGWAVDGSLPPQKDMDVFWQIGIQAKQFGQKLPEERWLNRKWLDAYPNLGSAGGGQQ